MGHPKGCYGCGRKRCSTGRSGDTVSTHSARDGLRGELLLYQAGVEDLLMAMSRSKGAVDGVTLQWVDEEFQLEYEALGEFMRETLWDDGKPRKTGTLLIVAEGKVLKCAVHDRDGRRGAWVTAETWKDLLSRIDAGLASDTLDWRKDTR